MGTSAQNNMMSSKFERNRFWTLKPEQGETTEQFAFWCQSVAQKCCFGKTEEEARANSIIDKVILFAPNELKERLLQPKAMDMEQMIQVISSYESIKRQAREILAPGREKVRNYSQIDDQVNRVVQGRGECSRCGKRDHTPLDLKCPARFLCSFSDHLAFSSTLVCGIANRNDQLSYTYNIPCYEPDISNLTECGPFSRNGNILLCLAPPG